MKEGTSVPRVLLTADPTHCSSVSHPFVSAYCRFAYTHTYNLIHTPIRTLAVLRSYDSAVRILPFHTIYSLITLSACIDHLRHGPVTNFFQHSDMQIQILCSSLGRR